MSKQDVTEQDRGRCDMPLCYVYGASSLPGDCGGDACQGCKAAEAMAAEYEGFAEEKMVWTNPFGLQVRCKVDEFVMEVSDDPIMQQSGCLGEFVEKVRRDDAKRGCPFCRDE